MKQFLPRGLYGRAALILLLPIVTIQLIVSTAFIQRHYEGVTRQMVRGVALELRLVLEELDRGTDAADALARAEQLANRLQIDISLPASALAPEQDHWGWFDFSGAAIIQSLHEEIPAIVAVDVTDEERLVRTRIQTEFGALQADISRRRMAATNPHQLLVLMLIASLLLTLIAFVFLRNQLRPIAKLADVANAFGRGERLSYRPRGATEVRAAGRAFVDMRERIERQMEQRTTMLSGVSHDLRTPLTRMHLALSLMPEDEDTRALQGDVVQMERMVNEFLAFVKGDATEGEVDLRPDAMLEEIVADMRRGGAQIAPVTVLGTPRMARLRAQAVRRAVENLLSNALRYGTALQVEIRFAPESLQIAVEDNGPGIPEDQRETAMQPFTRLGQERDQNRGGGVGLGLSITADVAASHGGRLRLTQSKRLGGLRAELRLAR